MKNEIKPSTIKPINGFVLIRPDDHYSTYQFAGRETGIFASNHSYMNKDGEQIAINVKERNFSVRGTVLAVPQNLIVPDEKYHNIDKGIQKDGDKKGQVNNFSRAEAFNEYNKKVNAYDTDMEIEVGDRIFMTWHAHKDADIIHTADGPAMFIKYDQIVMTIDEKNRPKKMVNGLISFFI